jgi:hypothetical protein
MMKNWCVGPQYGVLGIEIQNNNSSVAIARGKDFDQQMERARLIAAAPAMCEALKLAEEVLEGLSKHIKPSQYKAIKMIGDALEKAEGRSAQ